MTTKTHVHRRAHRAAAATALAVTLLAATLDDAHAKPTPTPNVAPATPARGAPVDDRLVEHPCFATPAAWVVAVDGPLPRCHTVYGAATGA